MYPILETKRLVLKPMQEDDKEIDNALTWYGIKHGKRQRCNEDAVLPEICILSLKLPGYGHWSLYYKGKYYDPEFGVIKRCPSNAKLNHYWEIMN